MNDKRRTDPISPSHYQGFSNGAQVIDITENLTFNAGNAVKYLARAGRTDGQNKGNILEDLKKARWYINREIERQEPLPAGIALPPDADLANTIRSKYGLPLIDTKPR
ncbi:DUF3310 domain-containing protein [uncultured Corynebacterium sp.]|uniref:DUF3310 domain-containing protein n=1 Tax=uncultured Corynebacterium sp. TaxID=159447 RepID=UPI002599A51A|nr:DUF3310 domain-containing protein [uncultured Corynebacterium sp.]